MSATSDTGSPVSAPTTIGAATAAARLTTVVAIGVLVQAILAGVFVGGDHPHATDVHQVIGPALIVPSLAASIITRLRLRTTPAGRRAYIAGIGVTVTLIIEDALGFISGDHPGVLVLHIPVAVALFGLLVRQLTSLRQLIRLNPRS